MWPNASVMSVRFCENALMKIALAALDQAAQLAAATVWWPNSHHVAMPRLCQTGLNGLTL
jgi:hypothetical protein